MYIYIHMGYIHIYIYTYLKVQIANVKPLFQELDETKNPQGTRKSMKILYLGFKSDQFPA